MELIHHKFLPLGNHFQEGFYYCVQRLSRQQQNVNVFSPSAIQLSWKLINGWSVALSPGLKSYSRLLFTRSYVGLVTEKRPRRSPLAAGNACYSPLGSIQVTPCCSLLQQTLHFVSYWGPCVVLCFLNFLFLFSSQQSATENTSGKGR